MLSVWLRKCWHVYQPQEILSWSQAELEGLRNGSEHGEKIPKPVSCPVLDTTYDGIWWLKAVLVLKDGSCRG